jgi:hypothetical protein
MPQKRPKRSFSPTSDDGDLVVPPVGEHIDDTPPPEGQPIVRQAMAFNWDKSAAATVPTYSASAPAKPTVNYFLPGQAPTVGPSPTPVDQSLPAPTSAQRSLSPPCPPSPPTRRKAPSSRKKKSEGKIRHFNDQFSSQTGRFKVGPGFVHDPKAVEPLPVNHGSGPYSSMYRMGTDSSSTSMTPIGGNMLTAPPQAAPHQAARTGYPPMGTTSHGSSSAEPSRSTDMTTPASQRKASTSKSSSSKHRNSTKLSQTSEANHQYYRRDYEKDQNPHGSSKEKQKALRSLKGRSKESASSTPRSRSRPHDSASPALSTTTLHTNPGDNHASSPDRSGS